jgi:hypothetical protein
MKVDLIVSIEVAAELKCAVFALYSVVKQRFKCNTGNVCNCLIQLIQYRRSWTSLPTPFISAQQLSERTVQISITDTMYLFLFIVFIWMLIFK